MTQYYPGPWEVEIFYVDGSLTHKQRLNCNMPAAGDVGDPFSAFSTLLRNGTNLALNTAVDAYVALLRPLLASTTNITIANLYSYVPDSFDKTFQATYDINLLGNGAGTMQLNHYSMLTFTTQLGNNMKWQVMDDNATDINRIPIRDANITFQNLANYLVGTTGWVIARDGSFPAGKLNRVAGQNEALFKRRNR